MAVLSPLREFPSLPILLRARAPGPRHPSPELTHITLPYLGGGHARKPWYAEEISAIHAGPVVYSSEELLEFLSEE